MPYPLLSGILENWKGGENEKVKHLDELHLLN
jgi:hypothetical protein